MKSLLLMRHAEAGAAKLGQGDRERVLSRHGHSQAKSIGKFLKRSKLSPDRIVCSAVIRARETTHDVVTAAGWSTAVAEDDTLYSATVDQLLELLSVQPEECQCLLLVAHAPGIPELAAALTTPGGRVALACPPATLFHIELECGQWDQVDTNTGVLRCLQSA